MRVEHVYFYWDAAYGPEVLSRGAGDAEFSRPTPAWRQDRRAVWRLAREQTPRVDWIPPAVNTPPRVAVLLEPARTLYPRRNNVGATGWSGTNGSIDESAPLAASGLLPLVPGGLAARVDNTSGSSDATALAPNHTPSSGTWQASVFRRRSTDRFYERIPAEVTAGRRVQVRVPPGEEHFFVLPQLEQGDPTSPWPMPATNSPINRGADELGWLTYLPPGTPFYLHHEFAWEDGIYSLGVVFGPLGFATVLRKPDGEVIEEPETGLPPLTIEQGGGQGIRVYCDPGQSYYKPLSLKLLDPSGFSRSYSTLEGYLAEAERLQMGPGGYLITDEP